MRSATSKLCILLNCAEHIYITGSTTRLFCPFIRDLVAVDAAVNTPIVSLQYVTVTVLTACADDYVMNTAVNTLVFASDNLMKKLLTNAHEIGSQMEYFIATGSLRSRSNLGWQQVCLLNGVVG